MTGRKPRKDELALWNHVAERVTPIQKKQGTPELALNQPSKQNKPDMINDFTLPNRIVGGKKPLDDDLAPTIVHALSQQTVAMDQKTFKQMQRGKLKPDGRIDLHGMTTDRAHTALTRFVLSSHASGKRLLLVITGKGKNRDEGGPIPVRFGVLRHQVPEWLRLSPLAPLVLQVTQAHSSHGGGGAFYVYLRRSR